jgi:hypothetical protein
MDKISLISERNNHFRNSNFPSSTNIFLALQKKNLAQFLKNHKIAGLKTQGR